MKSKTVILMMVAICCGLAASYMTSRVIADRQPGDAAEEKVAVLVAKQNLALGTSLKDPEKLFEHRQYILGQEPKKAIKDFTALKDQRLNKPITAEQFVTVDDLLNKDQDGIASLMQKGMRAFAIKVSAESSSGGFILPHSRVDILSVIDQGEKGRLSKIVLQNVNVLAVDTIAGKPEDKTAIVGATITVEVTPAESEKLHMATEMGNLKLILRAFGDDEKVRTPGVARGNILQQTDDRPESNQNSEDEPAGGAWDLKVPDVKAKAVEKTEVVVKAPEPPKTHTMVIFNGGEVTRAVFQLEGDGGSGFSTEVKKEDPTATSAQPEKQEKPKQKGK